jgi:hypothetical protein
LKLVEAGPVSFEENPLHFQESIEFAIKKDEFRSSKIVENFL